MKYLYLLLLLVTSASNAQNINVDQLREWQASSFHCSMLKLRLGDVLIEFAGTLPDGHPLADLTNDHQWYLYYVLQNCTTFSRSPLFALKRDSHAMNNA